MFCFMFASCLFYRVNGVLTKRCCKLGSQNFQRYVFTKTLVFGDQILCFWVKKIFFLERDVKNGYPLRNRYFTTID